MSVLESLSPGDVPSQTPGPKRRRFAGERLGAWVFAASFSIGIWGLALKIVSPSHVEPAATSATRRAVIIPSSAGDGKATVVWADNAFDSSSTYPLSGDVPIISLGPPEQSAQDSR